MHYFVKDRELGFRCLNCNQTGQDLSLIKSMPCHAVEEAVAGPKPSQINMDARRARELQLAELRELEAEGLLLQELLEHSTDLMALEAPEAEEAQLQAMLKHEEEADILQAKIQSLAAMPPPSSTPKKNDSMPPPKPSNPSPSSILKIEAAESLAKRALNFEAVDKSSNQSHLLAIHNFECDMFHANMCNYSHSPMSIL